MAFIHDDTAGDVGLRNQMAGERLVDQPLKSYQAVRVEANATIISAVAAQTIGGGVASDTHLIGIHIAKALTGTCVITGFADNTATAKSFTLPIGSVGLKEFFGALNTAGALTVTCADAADDDLVMVLWRPAT